MSIDVTQLSEKVSAYLNVSICQSILLIDTVALCVHEFVGYDGKSRLVVKNINFTITNLKIALLRRG